MTVGAWLKTATNDLESNGITSARLDAIILLEEVLGIDRSTILAEPGIEISEAKIAKLQKLLNQRAKHVPLAYIRGKTEFYGREYIIGPAVLEPRPESETLIDELLQLTDLSGNARIADVGAGSGALGITAALELPNAAVDLLEIDPGALKIAQSNVDKFTLHIYVVGSDLLNGSSASYDVLLCNLPYVPDDYQINLAAHHEPKLAIFGGADGLDIYRQLFLQLKDVSNRPLYILTESLPLQHAELSVIAGQLGYVLLKKNDFIQVFKCIQ